MKTPNYGVPGLSIESIGVLERFKEEVGADIDFHQDGYLFRGVVCFAGGCT